MKEEYRNSTKSEDYRNVQIKELGFKVVKCEKKHPDGEFKITYQIWSTNKRLLCECTPEDAIDTIQLLGFDEIFR